MNLVLDFYKFMPLTNLALLQKKLSDLGIKLGLVGSITIAEEGVKGFLSAPEQQLSRFLLGVADLFSRSDFTTHFTLARKPPFYFLRVNIKRELISLGDKIPYPLMDKAQAKTPSELQCLLDNKTKILLIDMRNHYETHFGHFASGKLLHGETFNECTRILQKNINGVCEDPLVLYCSTGIRSQKVVAWLMAQKYKNIFFLETGILGYFNFLLQNGHLRSYFLGECFVFDTRFLIDGNLKPSEKIKCWACNNLIDPNDRDIRDFQMSYLCAKCQEIRSQRELAKNNLGREKHHHDLLIRWQESSKARISFLSQGKPIDLS